MITAPARTRLLCGLSGQQLQRIATAIAGGDAAHQLLPVKPKLIAGRSRTVHQAVSTTGANSFISQPEGPPAPAELLR